MPNNSTPRKYTAENAADEPVLSQSFMSYRPPSLPGDGAGEPGSVLSRGSGRGVDLVGAIFLSIAAVAFVVFAGLFVDSVLIDDEESFLIGAFLASVISLGIVVVIARVTLLPKATAINMLGLAALANVLIHLLSDAGASSLLGVPPGFIESAILSGIPFGVAWLYTTRKYGRSLRDLGLVMPAKPQAFLVAIGAWVAAYLAVGVWSQLVSGIDSLTPPDNTTTSIELAGGSGVLAILLVGILGPMMEEIFFRGFLLGGLRKRTGPWPAILISSAVFALFHISPGLLVPTFLLGVAFGWVYLKTRSVWPCVLVHALHNTISVIVVWQGLG